MLAILIFVVSQKIMRKSMRHFTSYPDGHSDDYTAWWLARWLVLVLQFRLDACRCRVGLGSAQGAKDRTSHWLVVDHRQELQIVF